MSPARPAIEIGREIARLFAHTWRPAVDEVAEPITPALVERVLDLGGAALILRRLPRSNACEAERQTLERVARMEALKDRGSQMELLRLLSALSDTGIRCMTLKGWALASRYPERGLRPYADLDLCVAPGDRARASSLIASLEPERPVDLHVGFARPPHLQPFSDLEARAVRRHLDGIPVLTMGQEDELRFLCIHFMLHGGWRPLWLCDIALLVEERPDDFDWELCLGTESRFRQWVLAVLGLCASLLGAETQGTPAEAYTAPSWFEPAILRQWGTGPGASSLGPAKAKLARKGWSALPGLMRRHWRNPIQATAELQASLYGPRLPLQIAATARRFPAMFGR